MMIITEAHNEVCLTTAAPCVLLPLVLSDVQREVIAGKYANCPQKHHLPLAVGGFLIGCLYNKWQIYCIVTNLHQSVPIGYIHNKKNIYNVLDMPENVMHIDFIVLEIALFCIS